MKNIIPTPVLGIFEKENLQDLYRINHNMSSINTFLSRFLSLDCDSADLKIILSLTEEFILTLNDIVDEHNKKTDMECNLADS